MVELVYKKPKSLTNETHIENMLIPGCEFGLCRMKIIV